MPLHASRRSPGFPFAATIVIVIEAEPTSETLADGVLRTDTSHFPVVLLSWHGNPTVESVEITREWLDRMLDRAKRESTKLYLINDTSDAQVPKPQLRRSLSSLVHHLHDNHGDTLLGGSVIVPSALLRATFIMVSALARLDVGFRPAKGLDQALERAFAALDEAGVERPASLEELARGRSTG